MVSMKTQYRGFPGFFGGGKKGAVRTQQLLIKRYNIFAFLLEFSTKVEANNTKTLTLIGGKTLNMYMAKTDNLFKNRPCYHLFSLSY